MRVVIIGAGNAGRRLAAKLCEEKHDIVLIDHREQVLEDMPLPSWISSPFMETA